VGDDTRPLCEALNRKGLGARSVGSRKVKGHLLNHLVLAATVSDAMVVLQVLGLSMLEDETWVLAAQQAWWVTSSVPIVCAVAVVLVMAMTPQRVRSLSPSAQLAVMQKLKSFLVSEKDESTQRQLLTTAAKASAALSHIRARKKQGFVWERLSNGNVLGFFKGRFDENLLERMRNLEPYRPPIVYNPHLLTCGAILRFAGELELEREILTAVTEDGFKVQGAMDIQLAEDEKSPTVLIVPGFKGTSERVLYKLILKTFQEIGFHTAILHDKGEVGVRLSSHRIHKLDLALVHEASNFLQKKFKKSQKMFGVGFSQGGPLILKHSLLRPNEFSAVMTVGSTLAYDVALSVMETCLTGRAYSYALARLHVRKLEENREVISRHRPDLDIDDIARVKGLSELDRKLAVPLYGVENVKMYWESLDLFRQIHEVSVPYLCMHSSDDPLFVKDSHRIQREAVQLCENLLFLEVPNGGHLSFCEASRDSTYTQKVLKAFFKGL